KYPEAIESYQKAIAIKSTVGAYHNNLADAYAKSGQADKAVQEYAAAAEAEPANAATYYFNEGAVFTNGGKADEAIAAFDKAIQADPTKAAAYYWKGINLLAKATTKATRWLRPRVPHKPLTSISNWIPPGSTPMLQNNCLPALVLRWRPPTARRRRRLLRNRNPKRFVRQRAAVRRPFA